MNQFKILDSLFPTVPNRSHGEVVSVSVHLTLDADCSNAYVSWKRKAWYVNASVNAWHLHRGLCQELNSSGIFPVHYHRAIKRELGKVVMRSYLSSYVSSRVGSGRQYFEYRLNCDFFGHIRVTKSFANDDVSKCWVDSGVDLLAHEYEQYV